MQQPFQPLVEVLTLLTMARVVAQKAGLPPESEVHIIAFAAMTAERGMLMRGKFMRAEDILGVADEDPNMLGQLKQAVLEQQGVFEKQISGALAFHAGTSSESGSVEA